MPTLGEVALDAIYPIAFAALPIGGAAALALHGFWRSAALLASLALLMEEEAALAGLGLGLLLLVALKAPRRLGGVVLLTSALWLGVGELAAMPRFQHGQAEGESRPERHFGELQDSPLAWLGAVAVNRLEPDLVRALDLRGASPEPCPNPGHCSALRWWVYPTGGIALLSPQTLLIAGPPAAALLLADRPGRFRRHWAAPMLPIIWLATAAGLANLAAWPRARLIGVSALVLGSALTYSLDASLPFGGQFEPFDVVATPLGTDLDRLNRCIPARASVGASRRGLAHLANREHVYVFPGEDYGPGLWPPAQRPSLLRLDLRNGDTVRALQGTESPLRGSSPYRELARTDNALLLQDPASPPGTMC
jgi:hypothetical protein